MPTLLALPLIAQAGSASPFGDLGVLGMVPIFFLIFYFMIIRPQQQQQKKLQGFLDSLKKGDEVVTTGGLIGKVDKVTGAVLLVDFGNNTKIRVLKAQVTGPFVPVDEKAETKPETKSDSKADPASTEKK